MELSIGSGAPINDYAVVNDGAAGPTPPVGIGFSAGAGFSNCTNRCSSTESEWRAIFFGAGNVQSDQRCSQQRQLTGKNSRCTGIATVDVGVISDA